MKILFCMMLTLCLIAYATQPVPRLAHGTLHSMPIADVITYRTAHDGKSLWWRVAFLSGPHKNMRIYKNPQGKLSATLQTGNALTLMNKKSITVDESLKKAFHDTRSIIYKAALEGQINFDEATWHIYEDKSVKQLWPTQKETK